MRTLWLLVLVGCGGPAPRSSPPPLACPDPAAAVPGFPAATPIPAAGMATSLNPGMNSAREVYVTPTPPAEVIALYDRCLGAPTRAADARVYRLAAARGSRTIEVAPDAAGTVLTVACERCY